MGKNRMKRAESGFLTVLTTWLVTLLLLLALESGLAVRLGWGCDQLSLAGAAALFVATTAAAFIWGKKRGRKGLVFALTTGAAMSLLLLLTGFLIDAKAISLPGIARVVLGNLLGCLIGFKLSSIGRSSSPSRSVNLKKRRSV